MSRVILWPLTALFGFFMLYVFMPTLNFSFPSFYFSFFLLFIPFFFALESDDVPIEGIIISILFLVILLIGSLLNSPLFHSNSYYNLIEIGSKERDFSTDFEIVDNSNIRIIDKMTAERLGGKRIGEVPSLGSRVVVGDYSIQSINGKLYWVAPLEHSGFFKYNAHSKGTPGYIKVSATNERDVELVQKINGKEIFIQYQPGAFFSRDLERHLYFNGYMSTGTTDYTFEIDDEGNPFWVITLFKKKIGFFGDDAYGILLVEPNTGDIKEYSIEEAPKWVDRIQPENFVESQLSSWGKYPHGFWNLSGKDKKAITSGSVSLVYGNDGKSYWYSGVTSMGSDNSTMGFVLVDTRTKNTVFYRIAGATESSARSSAEGKVQEKGYTSTNPILYNISGTPTYVMSLKDAGGLIKMIAMVSVEDYSIVGVGDNVRKALGSYKSALSSKGNIVSSEGSSDDVVITDIISRINQSVQSGNSMYHFTLKKQKGKWFILSSDVSQEVILSQPGDFVKVSFGESGEGTTYVSSFDNLNIGITKTSEQKKKERDNNSLIQKKKESRINKNADSAWDSLTPKEKKDLLKKNKNN